MFSSRKNAINTYAHQVVTIVNTTPSTHSHIDLSNKFLGTESLENISKEFTKISASIISLSLNENYLFHLSAQQFANFLKLIPLSISRLSLAQNWFHRLTIKKCEAFSKLSPFIKHLNLCNNSLGKLAPDVLNSLLSSFPETLVFINLSNNHLNNLNLIQLVELKNCLPQIKHVALSHQEIKAMSIKKCQALFEIFPNVTDISYVENKYELVKPTELLSFSKKFYISYFLKGETITTLPLEIIEAICHFALDNNLYYPPKVLNQMIEAVFSQVEVELISEFMTNKSRELFSEIVQNEAKSHLDDLIDRGDTPSLLKATNTITQIQQQGIQVIWPDTQASVESEMKSKLSNLIQYNSAAFDVVYSQLIKTIPNIALNDINGYQKAIHESPAYKEFLSSALLKNTAFFSQSLSIKKESPFDSDQILSHNNL